MVTALWLIVNSGWTQLNARYEISYVNGVAVDTTSVPNGSILDVKIFSNGYYTYHVDLTGFAEPDNPQYGGFGGHGTFEFNEEKNTLDFISCKDIIYEMEELLINYSGEYSGVEPLKQFPPFHFFIFYGFLEEQQPLSIEQSKL